MSGIIKLYTDFPNDCFCIANSLYIFTNLIYNSIVYYSTLFYFFKIFVNYILQLYLKIIYVFYIIFKNYNLVCRFISFFNNTRSRPTVYLGDFLRPQTATNRLCGLCLGRSGTCPNFLFARHGAKQGASGFVAAHGVHRQSDSQRETPDKRVAFSEVHKLSLIVFDFFKYDFLLIRQCCG